MDRRDFLTAAPSKRKILARTAAAARTTTGLSPYAGPWNADAVQHLLKRTMFGSTKADIDYFRTKTLATTLDELLMPTAPLPAPPLNDYNNADPTVPFGQTWVNTLDRTGSYNFGRRDSLKKWWIGIMKDQDRSIREKMTLFWANHFGTEMVEIGAAQYAYQHNALLRQTGLGNFKTLVKAVTISTGMLRYLNGYLNTATAPDENYARELQELFTLGKGPGSQYTENDVKEAARVLTGWRINDNTLSAYFDPTRHDRNNKTFSSFYGGATIAGRTGAAGANETDDLISMIFLKDEVSKYICRRLYTFFVYYKIDPATETNLIEPLAQIFRNANWEMAPVLKALFQSEHFFDAANTGCLIKSPLDLLVGSLREFGVVFPDRSTAWQDAYGMWGYIKNWSVSMAQDPGDPPTVSGWPAYYQAPGYHELWINSDTLPKRNRYTDIMIGSGYTRNGKKIVIDAVAFTKTLPGAADPNLLIDAALAVLYRVPLSAATKQRIKESILLSGQTSDHYWTTAWNAHLATPGDMAAYNIVNSRLKSFYQYLMNAAEYQLA